MSTIEPESNDRSAPAADRPIARMRAGRRNETPEEAAARVRRAVAALERIAQRGGFRHIKDPGEWQREIREDRPLPGRDY
ncbi:MAG TPA: hypothetical protein VF632_00305 [Longimicrobium sp.]